MEEIKSSAAELGKESTLPEHIESQSAQYEELYSNMQPPETKIEETTIESPIAQTGILVPQNVEVVTEENKEEVVQQEATQENSNEGQHSNEGQTERGGDNAECEPEPEIIPETKPEEDLKYDTEPLVDEKIEEEPVENSPSNVPEVKKQSPIGELLLSMEKKLEEERLRAHQLELENQECNPLPAKIR